MAQHAFVVAVAAGLLAFPHAVGSATWYVADNGVDGPGCLSKANPCRSISRAIGNAAAGDKVVVGPGRYGDLNINGTLGEPGEETPAPGCGCMLAVNKPISLTSSDGAAATVIDARTVNVATNVLIITTGGEVGKPGKGFTVTHTMASGGSGMGIDANDVAVRGNLILAGRNVLNPTGVGIGTVNSGGIVLIEANHVIGWSDYGIRTLGSGKTVRKNHVSTNNRGIDARGTTQVIGNVVTAHIGFGVSMSDSVTVSGNALRGNLEAIVVQALSSGGTITKNNITGNRCGIDNFGSVPVDASNNFWGASTGPGPDPADEVCFGQAATTTAPFATKAFPVKVRFK